MLQNKTLQRRRHEVQRQLTFWPDADKNLWEKLDPETHKRVIASLSSLIEKAVRPHDEAKKDATKRE
jgi:hypothetical protein